MWLHAYLLMLLSNDMKNMLAWKTCFKYYLLMCLPIRYFLHAICLVVVWEMCLHEKYVLMLFVYMPTCLEFMLVANMLIACITIKDSISCAHNTNTLSLICHNVLNCIIWIFTLSTYDRLLCMHLLI